MGTQPITPLSVVIIGLSALLIVIVYAYVRQKYFTSLPVIG